MPQIREYDNPTKLLIAADYTERHYNAAVRDRFRLECESRGYEVRDSLRYKKGLQAWKGGKLVGDYRPNGAEAWLYK